MPGGPKIDGSVWFGRSVWSFVCFLIPKYVYINFIMNVNRWLCHFDTKKFRPNEVKRVQISLACVFAFMAIGWPLIVYQTGIMGWIKFWLMPWLGYHFWVSNSLFTFSTSICTNGLLKSSTFYWIVLTFNNTVTHLFQKAFQEIHLLHPLLIWNCLPLWILTYLLKIFCFFNCRWALSPWSIIRHPIYLSNNQVIGMQLRLSSMGQFTVTILVGN